MEIKVPRSTARNGAIFLVSTLTPATVSAITMIGPVASIFVGVGLRELSA